jgi:uncharacterized protein
MRKILFIAAVMLTTLTPAHAQSFNCRTADRPDEVLICQNKWLSALDEEMTRLYSLWLKTSEGSHLPGELREIRADLREIRAWQQSWLQSRIRCGRDYYCIEARYLQRIEELRHY